MAARTSLGLLGALRLPPRAVPRHPAPLFALPAQPAPTRFRLTGRFQASFARSKSSVPSGVSSPQAGPSAPAQRPRMQIQFTCTAPSPESSPEPCGHRNAHEFSAHAYHHGIVLVQCPACSNRHLIADHLQWFTANRTSDDPNFRDDHRTVVDLMRAKGESVRRGRVGPDGQLEPQTGEVLEYCSD